MKSLLIAIVLATSCLAYARPNRILYCEGVSTVGINYHLGVFRDGAGYFARLEEIVSPGVDYFSEIIKVTGPVRADQADLVQDGESVSRAVAGFTFKLNEQTGWSLQTTKGPTQHPVHVENMGCRPG